MLLLIICLVLAIPTYGASLLVPIIFAAIKARRKRNIKNENISEILIDVSKQEIGSPIYLSDLLFSDLHFYALQYGDKVEGSIKGPIFFTKQIAEYETRFRCGYGPDGIGSMISVEER